MRTRNRPLPDGRLLAYQEGMQGGWAIWMLRLDGDRKPYPLHESQFSEREAAVSPEGKWLAYCSNESGEYKVYVVPFPGPGGKWQVSPGGGSSPRWRRKPAGGLATQVEDDVLHGLTAAERRELLALLRQALSSAPPQPLWRAGEPG